MRMWLRCWLLALCIAAFMATSTLADGTLSLKVSEINNTPIKLGKACCGTRAGSICDPDTAGAPCEFNFECPNANQACFPVVCDIATPSHCPIGNSVCQLSIGGADCSLPTVLNAGDVVAGDIIRVDAFLKEWDENLNQGLCLARDAVGTCTIFPDSCVSKTVCSNSGSDCNATRLCINNVCQGAGQVACNTTSDCTNFDCTGTAQCIPNECQVTPLLASFQWSFDVSSFSSGSTGTVGLASIPCTVDTDCRFGETNTQLCTCAAATCQIDQTCNSVATAFFQQGRSDYIFGNQLGGFATVFNNGSLLEYSHAFISVTPVEDTGFEKSVGSFMVSPSIDATGVFTLGFIPDGNLNFYNDEFAGTIPIDIRLPVTIDMGTPPPACSAPVVQSWTSIGQHGPGCLFTPGCGGLELGQDIPAGGGFSESRSTGINKIVVVYDIPVDVTAATVMVDGCDVDGFVQNTAGIVMSVVAGANPNEAVILFSPSLPGNNASMGETPVVYDITLDGVTCVGGPAAPMETREAWAIFGDANSAPIAVNNGDLGFVRSARDLILARPPGMQIIDPNSVTAAFEIRADINNDNTVSNGDLGLVRIARDQVQQPTGLCP